MLRRPLRSTRTCTRFPYTTLCRSAAEKAVKTYAAFSDHGHSDAQASGVSPDYFALSSLRVANGRALTQADDDALAAVAVLGHQAAADLFPDGSDPEIGRAHVFTPVTNAPIVCRPMLDKNKQIMTNIHLNKNNTQ